MGGRLMRLCGPVVLAAASSAQGTLDEVREEVRAGEHGDDDWEHDDDRDFEDEFLDDTFDSFLGGGFDAVLENTLLLPWRLPRLVLDDADLAPARFARHPRRAEAYWLRSVDGEPADGRRLALRPRLELGTDFDDLERTAVGLELEHESRFGLELEWARWREDLGAGGTDELELGELSLVYRFAQSANAAFFSGVGLNVLDDARATDYGLDLTYGATFLFAPFTAGLEADLGTLGDASLTHLGASLGVVLGPCELFVGHDGWDLGAAHLSSTSLGLRGWL